MSLSSRTRTAPPAHAASSRPGHDIGLVLLRGTVGLTMATHGTQKLFGWFDGSGIDGTADHFAADGYAAAETMAVVAGLTETLCGLGLAIGLLHPLAAAGIIGIMLNAIATKWGNGFFNPSGIEYDLVLLAAAAGLALTGPGRFAADRLLPALRAHRTAHGAGAIALGALTAAIVLVALRD
ncbi:DoxX family protein [Streptomyces sp. NPDC059002]|uniref:DoxX family protein n=1 Tax=Streptomyces sp. NPDC059002 TaxID=3346690 RepID=UPI003681E200